MRIAASLAALGASVLLEQAASLRFRVRTGAGTSVGRNILAFGEPPLCPEKIIEGTGPPATPPATSPATPPAAPPATSPATPPASYKRLRKLGSGSNGEVWKAINEITGVEVAIKYIEIDSVEKVGRSVAQELKVGKLAATQTHGKRTLTRLLEHWTERKQSKFGIYQVLDLYDMDLKTWIAKEMTSESLPQIRIFMQDVLDGLKFLHGQGWMHLDVKPANIFLWKDDSDQLRAGLGDYGLASKDPSGNVVVTEGFRAPEVTEHNYQRYNTQADLWSLGCVLQVMLHNFLRLSREEDVLEGDLDPPFWWARFRIEEDDLEPRKTSRKDGDVLELTAQRDFVFRAASGLPRGYHPQDLMATYESWWHELDEEANENLELSKARGLLEKLLKLVPNERWDAARAREHEWFKM